MVELMLERAIRRAELMATRWGGKAGFVIMVVVVVAGTESITCDDRYQQVPVRTKGHIGCSHPG